MYIETALQKTLADDSAVAGYVAGKIFLMRAPNKTPAPYITLFKVSAPRDTAHDGATGLVQGRFQIDVFAGTYITAKDIATAVKAVLMDYSGDMANPGFPYEFPLEFGVPVNGCICDDETDYWEDGIDLYHTQMDFLLWYNE